jgi:LysR family transcriptional regulator, benzoate and cis,cis-muconate-responsive activator of ben and cat genes
MVYDLKILILSIINTYKVFMELRHLKYFLTLSQELSFVKAADKLFISQPPLSRQIKELEDELGVRLFERNNKRVELTDAGKYFQAEVHQLLESLERIAIKTKKIHDNISGEFRIAYISSTFSGQVSQLLKYLSEKFPYVNFSLYEVPTAKQIAALESGKIDLGIIRGPVKSAEINTRVWFRDSYSVVFNKNRFLFSEENDVKNLKDETFVFFNKEYAPYYYDTLLQICSKFGFIPKVVHETNNISSILHLVNDGLGASIVPSSVIRNYNYSDLGSVDLTSLNLFSEVLIATPAYSVSLIAEEAIRFLMKEKL